MTKSAQVAAASAANSKAAGRRVQVRESGVHGKGVFALRDIRAGATVLEYTGERISWKEALRRHPHDPTQPNHTFYFHIDDQHVIDANVGGNAARWINHACDTNCEADEVDGRIFIKTVRDVAAGEELFYDYGLVIDERQTAKLKKEYACHCGSPRCRGTMLAPKTKGSGSRSATAVTRGAGVGDKGGGAARQGKSGGTRAGR
jgi:SET domain-containing protein